MKQPPAFQFYADDFLGGTIDMTPKDVGAYIRLLCYQWNTGSIPNDPVQLKRIAGCKVGILVLNKFVSIENSRMINERLETERQKQAEFRAERSKSGTNGAIKRWRQNSSAIAKPIAQPMANDSSPSPSPSPIPKRTPQPSENSTNGHTSNLSGAEIVLRNQELERVTDRMRLIRDSYADHQSWAKEDKAEFQKLKGRKAELKAMLNLEY